MKNLEDQLQHDLFTICKGGPDPSPVFDLMESLFAQEDKVECEGHNGSCGYYGIQHELYTARDVPDQKEYFYTRGEASEKWPAAIDPTPIYTLYGQTNRLFQSLLDSKYRPFIGPHSSLMRLLHYLPSTGTPDPVRALEHTDVNLITILYPASTQGLQVKVDDEWIDVEIPQGHYCVLAGRMLGMLNPKIKPTIHRVVNSDLSGSVSRFALPFFGAPQRDVVLPTTPPTTYRDYLTSVSVAHSSS